MPISKSYDPDTLQGAIKLKRPPLNIGLALVHMDGSLHVGHLAFLEKAAAYPNSHFLVVGLKGTEQGSSDLLSALPMVDAIIAYEDGKLTDLLKLVDPDFVFVEAGAGREGLEGRNLVDLTLPEGYPPANRPPAEGEFSGGKFQNEQFNPDDVE